jgi:hypothetical protein
MRTSEIASAINGLGRFAFQTALGSSGSRSAAVRRISCRARKQLASPFENRFTGKTNKLEWKIAGAHYAS